MPSPPRSSTTSSATSGCAHPRRWRRRATPPCGGARGTRRRCPTRHSFGGESPFYRDPDPYERADDARCGRAARLDGDGRRSSPSPSSPRVVPAAAGDAVPPRHRHPRPPRLTRLPSLPGRQGPVTEASTEMPNCQQLPHTADALRKKTHDDWESYNFLVCATDDEHVVIRFEMATLESEPGLVSYMNVFSRTSSIVSEWRLKKVVEDWNITPGDGHLSSPRAPAVDLGARPRHVLLAPPGGARVPGQARQVLAPCAGRRRRRRRHRPRRLPTAASQRRRARNRRGRCARSSLRKLHTLLSRFGPTLSRGARGRRPTRGAACRKLVAEAARRVISCVAESSARSRASVSGLHDRQTTWSKVAANLAALTRRGRRAAGRRRACACRTTRRRSLFESRRWKRRPPVCASTNSSADSRPTATLSTPLVARLRVGEVDARLRELGRQHAPEGGRQRDREAAVAAVELAQVVAAVARRAQRHIVCVPCAHVSIASHTLAFGCVNAPSSGRVRKRAPPKVPAAPRSPSRRRPPA